MRSNFLTIPISRIRSKDRTRYDIIEDAIAKLPYAVRHWTGPVLPYEIQFLQQTLEVKRIGSTYEMSVG